MKADVRGFAIDGLAIGTLAFFALLSPALAEDGCGKFAWPLTRERTLLASANKAAVKAGDTLPALPPAAFALQLQLGAEAKFTMPPERKPKVEKWFGGVVHFPVLPKAGVYQVTLTDEAWVDIVQDGRYARSVGSTGRSDCPGLRKSVRLELTATPFTLQVSGVSVETIAVVFSPAD